MFSQRSTPMNPVLPFFLFALSLLAITPACAKGLDFKVLSLIPMQEGGRVKPLDTFSRETARFVTGKESFEGRVPMDLLLSWVASPEDWMVKDFLLVENLGMRKDLGIPKDQKRVSPKLLLTHEGFMSFARLAYAKREKKDALDPKEKEALALYGRLKRFQDIQSAEALTLVPVADPHTQKWTSLGELQHAYHRDGARMPEAALKVLFGFAQTLRAYTEGNANGFQLESLNFSGLLGQLGGSDHPSVSRMGWEARFNAWKPFRWAWILSLTAGILTAFSFMSRRPVLSGGLYRAAYCAFILGFLTSLVGFILRCAIAGRPPVTNMYESLIWVTFVMVALALAFERVFRNRMITLAASLLAWVGFVLADNVPTVLDPAITPIEPVLRSNFWLTIHVLTITSSYAAFLLALGVAHVSLWFLWSRPGDAAVRKPFIQLGYRVVQVGVVLLAAGTILGGVWANYSWGRFWGWDPKETWALIALLGTGSISSWGWAFTAMVSPAGGWAGCSVSWRWKRSSWQRWLGR
jgi:ABC-type transport system involved in cytochrome c biogenesis permease subunit